MKSFLAYEMKHRSRVHQLDFIGELLVVKVKNRIFLKLDSRYADYFPEYSNYFGGALILLKSMHGMTNSGKLFDDELTDWLHEAGFIQSQCQMSIYYKYAPYGGNFSFYLLLMNFYICILLKLLENGLWIF